MFSLVRTGLAAAALLGACYSAPVPANEEAQVAKVASALPLDRDPFTALKAVMHGAAKNRRRASFSSYDFDLSSLGYTSSDLINMLSLILKDPSAQAAFDMLASDPRIWQLMATMVDEETADMLAGFGEMDVDELLDSLDMAITVMGDMDLTELQETLASMADGGSPEDMMEKLQGTDLSTLAGDMEDIDLSALADSLGDLDLDALLGDVDVDMSDPDALKSGMDSGIEQAMAFQEKMTTQLEEDPELAAYVESVSGNLQTIMEAHENDNDQGEALAADMEVFKEQAIEEYMALDSVTEADRAAIEDGMDALTEVYDLMYQAIDSNVDKDELQRLVTMYKMSQGEMPSRGQHDCWVRCEPTKSKDEQAIDELIPTPPYMTPWQQKKFDELKAEYVVRYSAHPDFKYMSDQEKLQWQTALLQDFQKDLSGIVSSQQLKAWASVAYHTTG